MKSVRGARRLDQVINSTSPCVQSFSGLTDNEQAAVDRVESALDTLFDDALVAPQQCDEGVVSATATALPVGPRDEAWYQQEIERYQGENRRLLLENEMLREELKKFPLLDDPLLLELVDRLTPNDQCILIAMYELAATKAKPESSEVIVKTALAAGDHKTAFDRLKAEDLVGSARGRCGGQWLTARGRHVAIALMLQES